MHVPEDAWETSSLDLRHFTHCRISQTTVKIQPAGTGLQGVVQSRATEAPATGGIAGPPSDLPIAAPGGTLPPNTTPHRTASRHVAAL